MYYDTSPVSRVSTPAKALDRAHLKRRIGAAAAGINGFVAGHLSAQTRASGYHVESAAWHRAWNAGFAIGMLIFVLPLMLVITGALLVTQGNPFYRGIRLGKGGRQFYIYKFRTLVPAAAAATADRVLPTDGSLTTPLGGFLRDVRLDELPQLINVIRGDMNICGPRPVRPVIAFICAEQIPNYNARFRVRPGMIGHPQVFMSHGTPKRIRSAYHRLLLKRPANVLGELSLVAITVLSLLAKLGRKVIRRTRRLVAGRTVLAPACPLGARIAFECGDHERHEARITRITDRFVYFECPVVLDDDSVMKARVSCRIRGGAKWRHAVIAGDLKRVRRLAPSGVFLYVLKFEAQSDYSRHIILSYFLRRVVA
jgi:lipopolysaccharide/colanic/teichoic acid biosynthesis glycosyltransferase